MSKLEVQYDEAAFVSIGALGALDVVTGVSKIDAARLNGFKVIKSEIFANLHGKTANEGPIMFGLACNMTAAQIEAALEADPQSSVESDEKGDGQMLKPLGIIGKHVTGGSVDPINFPPSGWSKDVKWSIIEGQTLLYWVYNMSGSTLTSGATINIFAQHFGVWLRD